MPNDPIVPERESRPAPTAAEPGVPSPAYPEPPACGPEYGFDAGVSPPFRLDRLSVARIPLAETSSPVPGGFIRPAFPRDRIWVHVGLLLLTLATTTLAGMGHYLGYRLDFRSTAVSLPWQTLLVGGLSYSLTILAILGAHELGHYFACRYYRINASLPFFLPIPPPVLTGTLGAFIRIRQPIRTKRELFDIGVAGPLAGFLVAVPALVLGLGISHVAAVPDGFEGLELGEPLLFRAVSYVFWGSIRDGYSINLHPIAFAAWFGLLATMLNLFPIGQLDGGHISYAVFGRRSRWITLGTVGVAVVLTMVSSSWLVWTIVMIGMLFVFGAQHPSTVDEYVPLDRTRTILAIVALAVFVLCFTPAPIQPTDLLQK